jgi:hypothetical protein
MKSVAVSSPTHDSFHPATACRGASVRRRELLASCARKALLALPTVATLGVALSGTGYAATTLGNYSTTVNLSNYVTGNPFTINSGTTIVVNTGNAIYGAAGTSYTLNNAGLIQGGPMSDGIRLLQGSDVTNSNFGTISGGSYGLHLGAFGQGNSTVVNDGLIEATGTGGGRSPVSICSAAASPIMARAISRALSTDCGCSVP